jgi:hypothetical protein
MEFDCPRCGKIHGVWGGPGCGLQIANDPDRAGTIAELYEGRELPDVLKSLMNDVVECETLGGYLLMNDPARIHLSPKTGRETTESHLEKVAPIPANTPHQSHGLAMAGRAGKLWLVLSGIPCYNSVGYPVDWWKKRRER